MAAKRTIGTIFGDHLRGLRTKRGLTQVELAKRCGFPQARISQLERDGFAPNLATVLRLALALECKPSDLVAVFNGEDLARLLPK